MAHFGAGDWNNPCGLVAQLTALAANSTRAAAGTINGATEGTNLLTYRTVRAGMYRVSAVIRLNTVTDSGTTSVVSTFFNYSNGTAIATATLANSGVAPGTMDNKAGAVGLAHLQSAVIYATAGTDIVMNTREVTVGTTPTVGKLDILFVIEAV